MADRPILFSGPMVRALLAGTKTQTRRIFKPQPTMHEAGDCTVNGHRGSVDYLMREIAPKHWLRIKLGDRLYVRETWTHTGTGVWTISDTHHALDGSVAYQADGPIPGAKYWPSIHMPRRFSRLTLTVTDVRVERVQDCSEADALAEGMTQATAESILSTDELQVYATTHILAPDARGRILYETIWDQINGEGSWASNPWVAAYTFTVHRGNIDAPA